MKKERTRTYTQHTRRHKMCISEKQRLYACAILKDFEIGFFTFNNRQNNPHYPFCIFIHCAPVYTHHVKYAFTHMHTHTTHNTHHTHIPYIHKLETRQRATGTVLVHSERAGLLESQLQHTHSTVSQQHIYVFQAFCVRFIIIQRE